MPLMGCIVFHRSCTLALACTKLCMVCMTTGVYIAVPILPCRTDEHLCILCHPLHSALLCQIFAILVQTVVLFS